MLNANFVSLILHTVSLHKVVEVREGQRSAMFDKFPYKQVEKQSFSLVYQQEGRVINYGVIFNPFATLNR